MTTTSLKQQTMETSKPTILDIEITAIDRAGTDPVQCGMMSAER
jgi:hypothetical protein